VLKDKSRRSKAFGLFLLETRSLHDHDARRKCAMMQVVLLQRLLHERIGVFARQIGVLVRTVGSRPRAAQDTTTARASGANAGLRRSSRKIISLSVFVTRNLADAFSECHERSCHRFRKIVPLIDAGDARNSMSQNRLGHEEIDLRF
jgi:hypothetical protein